MVSKVKMGPTWVLSAPDAPWTLLSEMGVAGGWDVWWFIVKATVSRKPALISGNNGPSYITYSWGLYIYIILWQEWILSEIGQPGDRFNIKTSSYKYRDFHCKYKTVSPPFFIYNGNESLYLTRQFYIETGPRFPSASTLGKCVTWNVFF